VTIDDAERLRTWQRELADAGWVGIHWPVEYGGRGASPTELVAYHEEMTRAGAPPLLGRAGITLVGPTLLAHGTEDQRARWMARILSGDDIWCQLFSEPDAGSDLASLRTSAVRCGESYIVSGRKIWSSYAQFADWGIALCRTDPEAANHRAISMIAVDMHSPGVEVRPVRQMTGDQEFCEVRFEDVTVHRTNLIGPEHHGWDVANTTLANERGASFIWREQMLLERAFRRLCDVARQRDQAGDAVVRQAIARVHIDLQLLTWWNRSTLASLARGQEVGVESSLVKLHWAGVSQRVSELSLRLLGASALAAPETDDHAVWMQSFLATRANSIMGGTNEIQRTIIGERVLGLPREPRA
jgi:alkylation response protein AidB-like acyl-CoA dehydrogenase